MADDLVYKIAFSSLRGLRPAVARDILGRCGGEREFFEASESQLGSLTGIKHKYYERAYRDELLEKAYREADFVAANDIACTYLTDADYPARLTECDDAPIMIYGLGTGDYSAGRMLAIVGTRHATGYGTEFAERLVREVAERSSEPVTIVSGLAYGIDVAAHKAALKYGLPTIAVLAHGLNTIYPAEHRSVAIEIVRNGGRLVTEYKSSDRMHRSNFLQRNRIIAGLSDGVVVAESAVKGGAITTAQIACDYSREVMALPGRTSDRFSEGCNKLIAGNVAALITGSSDVMNLMRWSEKETTKQRELPMALNSEEQAIVDYLSERGEAYINEMSVALGQKIGRLMSMLIDMEFRGLVLTFPGGKYRLA